jgi:hypothetical protein
MVDWQSGRVTFLHISDIDREQLSPPVWLGKAESSSVYSIDLSWAELVATIRRRRWATLCRFGG